MSQGEYKHSPATKQAFGKVVEETIRRIFERHQHYPTDDDWTGIRAIVETIWQMAFGGFMRPDILLSSLPTGTGKTTAIVETVREIVRIGENTGEPVGVLVLVNTKAQIPDLIERMGLREDQYAVRTSKKNKALNARGLGYENADKAPVLFTTQQKLVALAERGLTFGTMHGYSFNGEPRPVRLWDESIAPAASIELAWASVVRLLDPLRERGWIRSRDQLAAFADAIEQAVDGAAVMVPGIDLPPIFEGPDQRTRDCLLRMAGCRVTVRHDPYSGPVGLFWEPKLPADLGPMLVTDASGAFRHTYALWEQERGGLKRLPSSGKTFRNLVVRVWRAGAGKQACRSRKQRWKLAQAVAQAVAEADGPVLVVHRLAGGADFVKLASEAIRQRDMDPEQVAFLTWGRHQATNEYADCRHVVLVGALHYSVAQVEGLARAAMGLPAGEPLPEGALEATARGEMMHHIWQAAGRSALRKTVAGDCPEGCTLTIIDGSAAVPRLLRDLFPEAQVEEWKAMRDLTEKQARLVREIERAWFAARRELVEGWTVDGLSDWELVDLAYQFDGPPVGWLSVQKLGARAGVSNIGNVYRLLRDPRVARELDRLGLKVKRHGWPVWAPGISIRRKHWPKLIRVRQPVVRWQPRLRYVKRITS